MSWSLGHSIAVSRLQVLVSVEKFVNFLQSLVTIGVKVTYVSECGSCTECIHCVGEDRVVKEFPVVCLGHVLLLQFNKSWLIFLKS